MLFLTAFWCRFCQRMDEGAFSDNENIALLNAYFVAIRAEDTQRPDVNTRYNLNGWPTIAFMAPQGELLGATNYLPSEEFGNLLARLYTGYQEKKEEIRSAGKTTGEASSDTPAAARNLSIRKPTTFCFVVMRRQRTLIISITSASPWTG